MKTKKTDKFILDVTCGARMIWFNKKHPNAIYTDIRKERKGCIPNRSNFEINPNIIMDFRDLQFKNKSFKLVIFDPPHLKGIDKKSWIKTKYGTLNKETWKRDISKGFNECWRVLEDYGILIFKWSCTKDISKKRDIPFAEILKLFPIKPIVGHTSGTKSNTLWASFMKIPKEEKQGILK